MLALLPLFALGLCASAASIPRQASPYPCSFSMNAVGEPNGTIVEDTIGENRIGGGFPQGIYYINQNTLFDALNHNCFVYPSTQQFECFQGAGGFTNYTVSDYGNLVHNGSEKWYACPATGPGTDGSYNIFSDALQNTAGCESITLRTGGYNCTALGRPDPSISSATPTATATTTPTASAPACPTDISAGVFENPHLIIPTSPQAPDHAFGNSYKAYIAPTNSTLFNFDIPSTSTYAGTCALIFTFPYGSDLDPSAGTYTFSGIEEEEGEHGGLDFALLSSYALPDTTYNSTPEVEEDFGKVEILPGNNYTVATFPCHRGKTLGFSATSVGGVELDYFQDDAPSPIGLWIVPCA